MRAVLPAVVTVRLAASDPKRKPRRLTCAWEDVSSVSGDMAGK
jgi:hypothetical protein